MKIYVIITALICCFLLLFPLVLNGIYNGRKANENTVTTAVTVNNADVLF